MVLCLEDQIRPDAKAAITQLLDCGVRPALLTGDTERPAMSVAKAVNIPEVHFSLKPKDKETWVRAKRGDAWPNGKPRQRSVSQDLMERGQLQEPLLDGGDKDVIAHKGQQGCCASKPVVGMLGDGLNDGPALAAADVGFAISAGLQLTLDAADVVVNKGDHLLTRISSSVAGAKACQAIVMQNLAMAALIKGSAIVLAATGRIGLAAGVLSDTGSFLVVLANSLRPLRWKLSAQVEAMSPQVQNTKNFKGGHDESNGHAHSNGHGGHGGHDAHDGGCCGGHGGDGHKGHGGHDSGHGGGDGHKGHGGHGDEGHGGHGGHSGHGGHDGKAKDGGCCGGHGGGGHEAHGHGGHDGGHGGHSGHAASHDEGHSGHKVASVAAEEPLGRGQEKAAPKPVKKGG